jgi:hypothetical protein
MKHYSLVTLTHVGLVQTSIHAVNVIMLTQAKD